MTWLEGRGLMEFTDSGPETRNRIARLLFEAWWTPLIQLGVIHGDPHLGNYTFAGDEGGEAATLNLLDFGCIRIFPPSFVDGVLRLYRALIDDDHAAQAEAYEIWGFKGLKRELIETLNIWARFIYGPLLEDRTRSVADGVSPGAYGRREAFQVKQALEKLGPVTVPREFVFMERAAIGLGSAFLRLGAEMNWRRVFEATLDGFTEAALAERQARALGSVGLSSTA
jgi:predicted unusual protein kinase regulating ubiquinone biosynthesis (AarF/ABC1/UbiB family)